MICSIGFSTVVGRNAMFLIIFTLFFALLLSVSSDGPLHTLGDLIRIKDNQPIHIPCRTARRLCRGKALIRETPSLSASRIATSDTSGRSSPSRNRFTPTNTSILPKRRSREDLRPFQGIHLGVDVAGSLY